MKVAFGSFAVLYLATLFGCGGSTGTSLIDQKDTVVTFVEDVGEASSDPKTFKALFAKGVKVPTKSRKKYNKGFFEVKSTEAGPDNTTKVKVVHRDPFGKILGNAEWTVVKEDGHWKLKSAPLP